MHRTVLSVSSARSHTRSLWRLLAISFLAVGVAAPQADAQTFTWTGNSNNNWKAAANWSPAGGPPNAIDAVAQWNVGTTGITTNVNTPVTVGSILVNQPDNGAANLAIKLSSNNVLTFQSSVGNATFINHLAPGATIDGTSTVSLTAPIQLNSPLDVTSGFDLASNTAVTFSGGITGNQTITLGGGGNLQLTAVGNTFTGQIVVNNGAVRLTDNSLTSAGNVTVNSGGQFQLGSSTVTNWSLGAGSVLYLNGSGKASGVNNQGAFRFQNNAAASSFDTPISLQSDSAIYVNGNLAGAPPTVGSLTISRPIAGPGVLTKNGTGVLVLANDNTYGTTAPTSINGGTLILANTLNDGGYAVPGDVTVGSTTNTNPTVLQLGATGQQLPATANIRLVASTATPGITGTFNLNSFNQTIGSLNSTDGGGLVQNNGITGNATLSIAGATVASSYTGVLQDGAAAGTGTLALAFTGPQSLTLSGASTYTGGTTISGGALIVNNTTGSATGSGAVTVTNATLAGTGAIAGPVSLLGATLAPSSGLAAAATLTLGTTTLDAASAIHYQLGTPGTTGGGVNDLAIINGDLTLAGTFNVAALSGFGAGIYELFSYTGTLIDNGLTLGSLPSGFSYSLDEISNPGEVLLKVTSTSTELPGDVNSDGIVNGQDIALIASNWLATGAGAAGDANHDGIVNGQDIALVASNWLATSGPGLGFANADGGTLSAVPEPGSMSLLALGLASGVFAARRRRSR